MTTQTTQVKDLRSLTKPQQRKVTSVIKKDAAKQGARTEVIEVRLTDSCKATFLEHICSWPNSDSKDIAYLQELYTTTNEYLRKIFDTLAVTVDRNLSTEEYTTLISALINKDDSIDFYKTLADKL
jgi:hypothetical protein